MDFTQFDSVAAAERGADCHVVHPASGKPLFDNPDNPFVDNGKPCLVTLLGAEAPSVRAANRERQKARAAAEKANPEASDDAVMFDDLHDRLVEGIAPRIIGFKNIRKGDVAATKEDAAWFLNLNRMVGRAGEKSFVEQLSDFSSSRGRYLGNALSD